MNAIWFLSLNMILVFQTFLF